MKTRLLLKIAASSLVLGATLVGCQTTGRSSLASASRADPAKAAANAAQQAAKAQAALAAGQAPRAIAAAEAAVAAAPRDAAYRTLLARAYLAGGRFASAETAYGEALTLDPENGQSRLSLALTQIALGRYDAAHETLGQIPAQVSVADSGLAYALAGDRRKGLEMLIAAARQEDASAKTRQNLALVYALNGMWVEARATAAVDLPADQVGNRMASWAQFAQPQSTFDQVATLLGVRPAADSGRPSQLALAPLADPVVLAAIEEPAPMPVPEEAQAPSEIRTVALDRPLEPMPAPLVTMAAADPSPFVKAPETPAPLIMASAGPIKAAPVRRTVPQRADGWVVQLGAFSTAGRVEIAWERAVVKLQSLGGFAPSSTTYVSAQRSAKFYRLSVAGFGSRDEAAALCGQVRAAGGACFVRSTAGDAPLQWVSRKAAASA